MSEVLHSSSVESAFIELIEIHIPTTIIPASASDVVRDFYFCNSGNVTFKDINYLAFPFNLTGLEQLSTGAPPRPKLTIATIDRTLSILSFKYNDIVGSEVIYIRTFEAYLSSDIGSYPISLEIYRKESHNRTGMSFELRYPTDRERDFLPKQQMLRNRFPGLGVNKKAT